MIDTAEHKVRLRDYFDGVGFERWSAIYGDTRLSAVRRTIRDGHAAMLALAEAWLAEGLEGERGTEGEGPAATLHHPPSVLDAGCGTGLFSIALARRGFAVTAVDIAPQMVGAARRQAQAAGVQEQIAFVVGDLEALEGAYEAVACLDVLVHYPPPAFVQLVGRLARMSRGPLLFTYAPREPLLAALHWVGGRFPRGQRRTDIQMIAAVEVDAALAAAGMRLRRQARVSRGFYHVALVEAWPVA
jgi:magnesium-protoporphyrin O-methyltransferase